MSRFKFLPALMIAGLLAACAQDMSSGGLSSTNPGSASQAPQPPNSLPVGASVNAPIASDTGVVGDTRVAPSRPARVVRATAARPARPVRRVRRVVRRPRPAVPAATTAPATTPQ